MTKANAKRGRAQRSCQVCGSTDSRSLRPAIIVRTSVADLVAADLVVADKGTWNEDGWICMDDLQKYRHRYVQAVLQAEKGELTVLEEEVLQSLREHEILASNPESEIEEHGDLSGRVADRVAAFGGSWTFISIFGAVLFGWIIVNSVVLATRPFDPYPYILLNLALSTLAAIQAPVIMMSQNRQEGRDRQRASNDYQINLKAELEIRHLHQKMDHLLSHQWQRLLEIQEIQLELINELRSRG